MSTEEPKEFNPTEKPDPIQEKAEENRKEAGKVFKKMEKEPSDFMNKLINSETARFKEPTDSKEDLLTAQAANMRKKSQSIVAPAGGKTAPSEGESFTIEGHRLPLSRNPFLDAMTTMMYIFSTILSKDKRIKNILNEAQFKFPDLDGNMIFPKTKKKKRKVKIHAKRRKHKSRK